MIRLLIFLQILLLIGCKSNHQSTQISDDSIDSKTDSIAVKTDKKNYQSIADDFKSKNQYVNPFDTISIKIHFPLCDKNQDTYKCFIDKLIKVRPPFFFGPQHEPKWSFLDCVNDSIYEIVIKQSLNDSSYFDTEHGDRTYCYYGAYLIDKVENYSLILMLFDYSAGFEYLLYTIDNEGKFIDKIMVGAMDSDYSETFGVLKNQKSGEIITNFFGYDSDKDELFIDKQESMLFSIDNKGKIIID